ncbi:hypothetical protein F5877DRAFT_71550 [Lentinula edodes]|nr:hypothetical protein F5877DRAFT_71550 [Lentinula edodes]
MSLYRRKVGTIPRTRIGHLICPTPAPIPPSPPLASYSPVTLPLMVSPPPSPYQGYGIHSQPTSSGVVQSNHNLPGFSNGINHSPAHRPNALNTVQPGSSCQVQQSNISPSTSNSQPRSSHNPQTNHSPGDTPLSEAPRILRADLGSGGVLVTTAPVAKESLSSLSTSVKAGRNNLTSSSSLPSSHRFIPPPIAVLAKVQTGKNISPVSTTRHPLPLIPSPPTIWSVPIPPTMGSNISSSKSFNLPPRPNVPVPSKPASSTTATRVNLSSPASSSSTYSVKYGMQHLVLDSNGNAIKPSSTLTRSKAEIPIKSSTPSISRLPTSGTVPYSPALSLPPASSSNIASPRSLLPRTGAPALGSTSSPVLSSGLPLSTTNPQTTTNGNPLSQGVHSALRSPPKLKKSKSSGIKPRTSVSIVPSAISLPRSSSTSVLPLEPKSSTPTSGPPRVGRVVSTSAMVDESKNRNDNPPNGVKSLPQVSTGQQLFSPNNPLMPQGINISIARTLPTIPPTSSSISNGSQAPPDKAMSSSASVSDALVHAEKLGSTPHVNRDSVLNGSSKSRCATTVMSVSPNPHSSVATSLSTPAISSTPAPSSAVKIITNDVQMEPAIEIIDKAMVAAPPTSVTVIGDEIDEGISDGIAAAVHEVSPMAVEGPSDLHRTGLKRPCSGTPTPSALNVEEIDLPPSKRTKLCVGSPMTSNIEEKFRELVTALEHERKLRAQIEHRLETDKHNSTGVEVAFRNEITLLKAGNETSQTQISSLETENGFLQNRVETLERMVTTSRQLAALERADGIMATKDVQAIREELELKRVKVEVLESELQSTSNELELAKSHLNEKDREIAQLHADLIREQALRREMEGVVEDMRRECKEPFLVPALVDAFMEPPDIELDSHELFGFRSSSLHVPEVYPPVSVSYPFIMYVRTYYHNNLPGVTSLPHDSLPPAAPERLETLGWNLWMLSGDDIEKQAAEIAERVGYTRPTDKINVLASETIESAGTVEEKVKMTAKLQASKEHYTATTSSVVLIVDGKGHYDIEGDLYFEPVLAASDPIENMWIRVILTPGVLMHIPGGAHTDYFRKS